MGFNRGTRRELQLERKVQALQKVASELIATFENLKVETEILQMQNAILKICLDGFEQQHVKHVELDQELQREIARLKALIQQGQSQGSGRRSN